LESGYPHPCTSDLAHVYIILKSCDVDSVPLRIKKHVAKNVHQLALIFDRTKKKKEKKKKKSRQLLSIFWNSTSLFAVSKLLFCSLQASYLLRQKPCDLYMVGDLSMAGSYAFAYRNNWDLADEIDLAILKMKEKVSFSCHRQGIYSTHWGHRIH
jgi:hypothetical protein